LMQVMAAEGRGFIALPTVITCEVARHYGFELLGTIEACRVHFHAITAERRILHPAVTLMTRNARPALPQTSSVVTEKARRRSPAA
ncbi:hypothetical protein RZS08_65670, partial [Arthrospira platensis SPKY1]|nr:hypothetical protein [Arthrospira platensis SPKY1]